MKILVFLWTFPPYRYVGGELATADLLEYLQSAGHEVMIYAKDIPRSYSRNGLPITKSAYLRHDIAREYDVFLTHPEIRTSVLEYVRGMPYVSIVHNVASRTMRSLERQAPNLTIVNSQFTYNHVPQVVHQTGLGAHIIHPPTLIKPTVGEHRHYSMVNISLEKGGSVLNYVAGKNPDTSFLGVLGGHGLQVTHQPGNVIQIPQTPDMSSVYADTKALLFPTHADTYGKVAAEALVCGVPVIASDLPAVREAGGQDMIYLDPYDYEGWDREVKRMQEPDVYAEWKARAVSRGKFLSARTQNDLERFESLMLQVAGK